VGLDVDRARGVVPAARLRVELPDPVERPRQVLERHAHLPREERRRLRRELREAVRDELDEERRHDVRGARLDQEALGEAPGAVAGAAWASAVAAACSAGVPSDAAATASLTSWRSSSRVSAVDGSSSADGDDTGSSSSRTGFPSISWLTTSCSSSRVICSSLI